MYLIDPSDVINYDRTDRELELFYLFCAVVAGKTATTQAKSLARFLEGLPAPHGAFNDTPFGRIHLARARGDLLDHIKNSRLGQYNRLHKLFCSSLLLDLRRCTVSDLEAVYGIGPKTARMFLMFTRPNQRFAALDTHLLKHLRANGIDAPMVTPPAGERYRLLENDFLRLVDASGMTVSDYDLMVWKSYAKGSLSTP